MLAQSISINTLQQESIGTVVISKISILVNHKNSDERVCIIKLLKEMLEYLEKSNRYMSCFGIKISQHVIISICTGIITILSTSIAQIIRILNK